MLPRGVAAWLMLAGSLLVGSTSSRPRAPPPAAPPPSPRPPPLAAATPRPFEATPSPPDRAWGEPVHVRATTTREGAALSVTHFGPSLPATAMLSVEREVWVATPDGVLRFDAHRGAPLHQTLSAQTGLPSTNVRALSPRHEGGFWIATDQGLAAVTAHGLPLAGPYLLKEEVTAVAPRHAGTAHGLYVFSPTPSRLADTVPWRVTALTQCGPTLYIGTHDHGAHTLVGEDLVALPLPSGVRVSGFGTCAPDDSVFAATSHGVFRLTRDAALRHEGFRRNATAIATAHGETLVGTDGDGVCRLEDTDCVSLTREGRVTALLARGPDWLIADEARLTLRAPHHAEVTLHTSEAVRGPIAALAHHRGALFVGAFSDGLASLRNDRWRRVPVFEPRVSALASAPDGQLWVGTARGLGRLTREGVVEPWSDPRGWSRRFITSLVRRGRTLWVGVHPGALALDFDPNGNVAVRYVGAASWDAEPPPATTTRWRDLPASLVGGGANAIAPTAHGVWFATNRGLVALTPEGTARYGVVDAWSRDDRLVGVATRGDCIEALTLREGLFRHCTGGVEVFPSALTATPGTLLVTPTESLFGTLSTGLVVLSSGRRGVTTLTHFTTAQGLASSRVSAALRDGTDLWVGGASGVDRIHGFFSHPPTHGAH